VHFFLLAVLSDTKAPENVRVMMMSFIVASATKLCLSPHTCLGSVFATSRVWVCLDVSVVRAQDRTRGTSFSLN